MPIVAHSNLPTFEKLRRRGENVLTHKQAVEQDIRELHIGLLNMMPDSAIQVTEQQFMRLVGASNQIAQFYVHPFSVPGLPRSATAQAYIDTYYDRFSDLQNEGLDAIIITGANVSNPNLAQEPFWQPLQDVIAWATEHVTSVLCSCLATHALLQFLHGVERQPLPRKQWGVYRHRIAPIRHPLLRGINSRFDVPHSRHNDISREQFQSAGLTILAESAEAGVHLAVSADLFRIVYFQGHPEYNVNSLLKEYKREALRFFNHERPDFPPEPEHYFGIEAKHLIRDWWHAARRAHAIGQPLPPLPEAKLMPHLDNTWGDTGKAIVNNWLGLVYQLTHLERNRPFAPGIDPDNPLGLRDTMLYENTWDVD
jgi:homoserine O-succinyltransferase